MARAHSLHAQLRAVLPARVRPVPASHARRGARVPRNRTTKASGAAGTSAAGKKTSIRTSQRGCRCCSRWTRSSRSPTASSTSRTASIPMWSRNTAVRRCIAPEISCRRERKAAPARAGVAQGVAAEAAVDMAARAAVPAGAAVVVVVVAERLAAEAMRMSFRWSAQVLAGIIVACVAGAATLAGGFHRREPAERDAGDVHAEHGASTTSSAK